MRSVLLGLCGFVCVVFIGCADPAAEKAQDELVQKTIAMMNESSAHFEAMSKDPSPENIAKHQAEMKILAKQMEANTKAIEKLPRSAQNRIDIKFKADLDQAEARMKKASRPFGGF